MKKFILILLAVCLLLGCVIGYAVSKDGPELPDGQTAPADRETVAAPAENEEPAQTEAPVQSEQTGPTDAGSEETIAAPLVLDFEAIRALHAPDEIVGSVDGRDVTWDEYFYWLHDAGFQAEQYIQSLAMYGQSLNWTDKLSAESEQTLAEYVLELTHDCVRQLNTIEAVAEENGVTLTAENEAQLAEQLQQTIAGACGEGASEEDFNALLEQEQISRAMYDRISRANFLYQNSFNTLYGANGEKVSEEDALAYLAENDYLGAAHILFMTVDPATFEALDDETAAQKLQQAEAVSAELRAITDVDARAARFAELKEQYCEDSGRSAFPDGYLFTPGEMVAEFEDGVKALEEYEVSEPVLSPYGYHVIMRLPLSAEITMEYSEAGTPLTARALCANEQFNAMMTGRIEASVFTLGDGYEIDLTEYLK